MIVTTSVYSRKKETTKGNDIVQNKENTTEEGALHRAVSITKANTTTPLGKPLEQHPQDLKTVDQKIDSIPFRSLASRALKTRNL